jgi:Xaa-Pro aminopeptidase
VALVRFLHWLEKAASSGSVTELSASARLEALRAEQELFRGPSFETIAAFREHGAVVHYRTTRRSDRSLSGTGLFLLDSGGQYLDGTTDVTRTVALGEPTAEQRRHFTLVLKGLIRLSRTAFPPGTAGIQLDILARLPLWSDGLDYSHGTGHGVGSYLNVHEGPQSISSSKRTAPLTEGMIVSLEPGCYRRGAYGIRIENLAWVARTSGAPEGFLGFETLTLCPIDAALVEPELLTRQESAWLNDYHRRVQEVLLPLLGAGDRRWLEKATRPI